MSEKRISRSKALELIDQKISGFERLLKEATFDNKYGEDYTQVYDSTESLLTELYSEKEAMNFRNNVTFPSALTGDDTKELQDYKGHIKRCISQLKAYRERIQNFWKTNKVEVAKEPIQEIVKEKKNRTSKTRKPILTLGNIISLIILVSIFLILNSTAIASFVSSANQPTKVELSLVPNQYGYMYTDNDLQKYGSEMTGVSGYAANIYLSFQNEDVEIGEAVTFHIEIAHLGNSLTEPYFYVFLVNNTGGVVSGFPELVYIAEFNKLSSWSVNGQDNLELGNNLFIPRQTLIAGQGDYWNNSIYEQNRQIWFQGQIADDSSQIGRWELWVFLCDGTYQTSTGVPISSQNTIAYTTQFFNVIPKTPPTPTNNLRTPLSWLSLAASYGFVILSFFGLFTKLSPWIDKHSVQMLDWWKRNKWLVTGCLLLLLVYIVLLLMGV
jgi:hypothetical protein